MPGLRSPDIPAWKIALKGGDLNPQSYINNHLVSYMAPLADCYQVWG
jgi:hypothetical protein